jgi:L-ascorbate metabolism protein UlaG (beta-lactamase superfamily)
MTRPPVAASLPFLLASACAHAEPVSPHFRDGQFQNLQPTGVMKGGGVARMLRRWVVENHDRTPGERLPVQRLSPQALAQPAADLRVYWLGHACLLVEIDGRRVLTDPQLSRRASPVSFAGPERFEPPPLFAEELPRLDAVVVSHNHYDHLDEATVRALVAKGPVFHVPLGVGALLRGWDVPDAQIVEHDWWDERPGGDGLTIAAVPSRHFSNRGVADRNATLWASWALVGPRHRVYFGGDTGFLPEFADIGKRYGPFDVDILPIGAYDPQWADIHLNPEEAVQAHVLLGGRLFVPMHWATFNLAFHPWYEPGERLVAEAAVRGVPLALPVPGEPVDPQHLPQTAWWRPCMPSR